MTVEEFAELLLEQRRERLRADYPNSPQWEWETVNVKPGKVYVKVDVGPKGNMSGKYMIEIATGVIYGIKGYGQVHKGHRYGTLDTVHERYWGGYTAIPKEMEQKRIEHMQRRREADRERSVTELIIMLADAKAIDRG